MVVDEDLESELSNWLQQIEIQGLGATDEDGYDVLTRKTESALVETLERIPLMEYVDTAINAKPQLETIDASLAILESTSELLHAEDRRKLQVDSALAMMGSIYHNLSEKLLVSSSLLNLAQEMTGARILLRPALESGLQGTFILLAVKPKAQSILYNRWNEIGQGIREFLGTFRPFRGPHAEEPDLDAIFAAAQKLRLNFRQVVGALDEVRMLWPIPEPRGYVGKQWDDLSAESHVSALQSLFTTSPSTDEIELKGGLGDFRHSYPNLFSEVVDVLAVCRLNYLKSVSSAGEPFHLTRDQYTGFLEKCTLGHLHYSEQLVRSISPTPV